MLDMNEGNNTLENSECVKITIKRVVRNCSCMVLYVKEVLFIVSYTRKK